MAQRLAALQVTEEDFTNVIIERSQGNFMYLVHVLRDIREGVLTIQTMGSIYKLPKGLKEYYQRHWRFMRENRNPKIVSGTITNRWFVF